MIKLSGIFKRNPSSELKVIKEAIDKSVDAVSSDLLLLRDQFNFMKSTGVTLDEWGSWFGLHRAAGDTDEIYSEKLMALFTTPKDTIPAILQTIRTTMGDPDVKVKVYEPFTNLFKFGISEYGSEDVYMGGKYYNHTVIDVYVYKPITNKVYEAVSHVKGGGIRVYFTRVIIPPNEIGYLDNPTILSQKTIKLQMSYLNENLSIYRGAYYYRVYFAEDDKKILCDSNIILEDIQDKTIEELVYLQDNTAYSAQHTTISL